MATDASLSHIDVEGTIQTVEENRDVIVGIKVLLSRPYATGTMVRGEEPAGENEAQTWASVQEAERGRSADSSGPAVAPGSAALQQQEANMRAGV